MAQSQWRPEVVAERHGEVLLPDSTRMPAAHQRNWIGRRAHLCASPLCFGEGGTKLLSHSFPIFARLDSGVSPSCAPAAGPPVGRPVSGVDPMPTVQELHVNGAKKPVNADAE